MPPRHDHPTEQQDDQTTATILALTVVLLSGLAGHRLLEQLTMLLVAFGVPGPLAASLLVMLGSRLEVPAPSAGEGSALRVMQRGVAARRAMYLVAAGKRLRDGGTVAAERRLFGAHERAEARRAEAVGRVDAAAERFGLVLGWEATLDERTTPLCRAAHGRNFRVDRPPEIGYPGTAHAGNCRCRPRRPWPDASMLP